MERALERALADWRLLPSDELADYIDDVSDYLTAATPALTAERWFAAASAPTARELGPVLASLPSFGDPLLPARLDLLHRWPRDPRIASGLHRLLCQAVPRANQGSLWNRLLALFASTGDRRAASWLQDAAAALDGTAWAVVRLGARINQVSADLIRLNPASRGPLPRSQLRVPAEPERPYLTPPRELEAKLVWADQLSSQGDVRGEAIILGALPQPRREQRRRASDLVRQHGRAWLGRLSPAFKPAGLRFRDGAVVAGRLSVSRLLSRLIGLPEWVTVEELDLSEALRWPVPDWRMLARLLADPSLRRLKRLVGLPYLALAALLKQGRPMPLEYLLVEYWPRGAAASAQELVCSKAFPELKTFVMGNERIELPPLRRQLVRRGLLDVS